MLKICWRIVYRGWLSDVEELKPVNGGDRAQAFIEATSSEEAVEKLKAELHLSKCQVFSTSAFS